jgi:hypothetical protein
VPLEFKPEVRADGSFEVLVDAETLSVFAIDPERRRSGFAVIDQGDSEVELAMEPLASFDGTLLDDEGQPLTDHTVKLSLKEAFRKTIVSQRTDEEGRFQFAGVPAGVPLRVDLEDESEEPGYYLLGIERLFEPGEVRENERISARRRDTGAQPAAPPAPLADRVVQLCHDVRVSGMHALVMLMGDDDPEVITTTGRLLDFEEVRPVLGFLPLRVRADQVERESEAIADFGWPRPAPGEIVLVALDGAQETIATLRIDAELEDEAVALGSEFLQEHGPPARDARVALAEAKREAKSSDRRVWVVFGGPRCAPCVRLARWMDEQHEALEKDFVIVKVLGGLDEHSAEISAEFPDSERHGVPWYAITDPDGSVLATSEGPLGNIGFPGSLEGFRHLRRMIDLSAQRMTPDDVDALIDSLASGR